MNVYRTEYPPSPSRRGRRSRSARRLLPLAVAVLLPLAACDDDPSEPVEPTTFQVTLENMSADYGLIASGAFDTPVGEAAAAPAASGMAYEASFAAGVGHRLFFATMFVQSNDFFYAPDENGIELYDGAGMPVTGDITGQVQLWDAGTETDEEPGVGANQAPRQAGADTGDADGDNTVRLATDASGNIDPVASTILVTLTYDGNHQFTVRIENIAADMSTSGGDVPVLISPGAFAVGAEAGALFTEDAPDLGLGLEAIAEDGDPSGLAADLGMDTGVTTPIAPGAWAVHSSGTMMFAAGQADAGLGLEALAEDGDPAPLGASIAGATGILSSGVFNTPVGGAGAAPALPGESYSFMVTAEPGHLLSFATMFVQSNDAFYAPDEAGLPLFSGTTPVSGDVSAQVMLWDAGTEENQPPGVGSDQAPRQAGPDTGTDEGGNVRLIDDGFTYPMGVLRVTITPVS